METFSDAKRTERAQRTFARLMVAVFLAYVAIGVGLYLWRGLYFTPDRWLVLLLVGALVMGKALTFLRDWVPVVLLIAGYEFMRKLAGQLVAEQERYVHVQELIDADRILFAGTVPTLWLQGKFYDAGQVHWYDYVSLLIYSLHFVFPLAFAFMLWLGHKERFWQFSLTFLLMVYAAFAFFLYYPAAPPWFANQYGYISGVEWPAGQAYQALVPTRYDNFDTVTIWNDISGNAVAAVPSLHSSFPWLVLLFSIKFFGRRGLFFLPYSPILWFSIVYLGHHWVVDILAGIGWATVCFVFVQLVWPWLSGVRDIPWPAPMVSLGRAGQRLVVRPMLSVGQLESRWRVRLIEGVRSPVGRLLRRSRS